MTRRKYYYTFKADEVDAWNYCPKCGGEILGIYPGDYYGHVECEDDSDPNGEPIEFKITWEDI